MAKAKEVKELENTLQVNGEEYNINAKQATRVENALKIKKNTLDEISEDTFDGAESGKEIDYVPASGGLFAGDIRVPDNTEDKINEKAVLNYGDIKNTVVKELLNNSVLYTWDGKTLDPCGDSNSIKSICIITGDSAGANSFAAANKNADEAKQISAFIYIAEGGSIYFGTSESATVAEVTVNANKADTATKLATSRKLSVNLNKSTDVYFDGSSDVALNVTGTLPASKGGTGKTSLVDVTAGKATKLETARNIQVNLASTTSAAFDGSEAVTPGVTGVLPVANGGTGASDLGSLAVGKSNSVLITRKSGGASTGNAYGTLIVSTDNPSGGSNGDIWIKYKA